jgi:hypothetical protein
MFVLPKLMFSAVSLVSTTAANALILQPVCVCVCCGRG